VTRGCKTYRGHTSGNAARRSACAATMLFLGMAPMLGQALPSKTPLAFEVASVKPAVDGMGGVMGGCHGVDSIYAPSQKAGAPSPGRCVIANARLSHLINIAWDLRSMALLKSGPDWIARGDERFNVVAKAEEPGKATEEQLLSMLQTLLIERFQLKFHRETTEMPGFALMRAKTGTKLRESESQEARVTFSGEKSVAIKKPAPGRPLSLNARGYSMPMLVNLLSRVAERGPGIDKTGLDGVYDFTLSWDEDAGPSLSTALREQLGLRMESEKVPVSLFVVDSAQRPSGN
jgi:uncharacterized protein (TIGR03435 family)